MMATRRPAAFSAARMRAMETTVRELLAAAQAARKAKLDAGWVDTVFKVGDQVLLGTKELLDAADIGKLLPRWDGPFAVIACQSPNAYTLAQPGKMRTVWATFPFSKYPNCGLAANSQWIGYGAHGELQIHGVTWHMHPHWLDPVSNHTQDARLHTPIHSWHF